MKRSLAALKQVILSFEHGYLTFHVTSTEFIADRAQCILRSYERSRQLTSAQSYKLHSESQGELRCSIYVKRKKEEVKKYLVNTDFHDIICISRYDSRTLTHASLKSAKATQGRQFYSTRRDARRDLETVV